MKILNFLQKKVLILFNFISHSINFSLFILPQCHHTIKTHPKFEFFIHILLLFQTWIY